MINLNSSLNLASSSSSQSIGDTRYAAKDLGSSPRDRFLDRMKDKELKADVVKRSATQEPTKESSAIEPSQSKSETAPSQSESLQKSHPVTRQAAMSVFLERMEADLGVQPERVIEAFGKLTPEQLVGRPEDSALAVVSQLDLDPSQKEKALTLYNEMLAMTAVAGLSQQMVQNKQAAEINVLSKRELHLRDLRASIDNMSDRFFVTGEHAPVRTAVDQQAKGIQAYAEHMKVSSPNENLDATLPKALMPEEMAMTAESSASNGVFDMSGLEAAEGNIADLSGFAPSTKPSAEITQFQTLSQPQVVDSATLQNLALDPQATPDATNAIDGAVSELRTSFDAAKSVVTPENMTSQMNAGVVPSMTATSGDAEFSSDSEEELASEYLGADPQQVQNNKVAGEKSFTIESKTTPADVQNNVKEIISQARYLADKGGGEMKVSLNPEGMGELNLKVKMTNGNVNVEMVTSSEEAKKLLEKGLNDLKDSLATHKLHLDGIKIESSKDISHHLDQQQKDFEQGFQQKFLSDFKERNQGWKREMFELGSATRPDSQVPARATKYMYDPSANKKSDSSRRLDLVA